MSVVVSLVDEPIDPSRWSDQLSGSDIGAEIWFHGVTREKTQLNDGTSTQWTQTLFYEAHRSMALSGLQRLGETAIADFAVRRIVIVHRLGEVPVGQCSVLMGCGSAHRDPAIDAIRWMMDTLKREIPIWKQERFQSGSSAWIHPEDSAELEP